MELFQYAQALGSERLATPRDDITSALMHAEVDGERLSEQEFGSFFILLVAAGNETTRNAISHGMKALTDWPDAAAPAGRRDFERHKATAVEEIVRWATPVIHFRRTATRDTVLGGQPIAAGDKVVMWYNSANRDEAQVRRSRTASTSRASPTSTSASAPAARTSASAPTSPGARSR